MTLVAKPPASYSSVSRCAVKRLLPCLFLLGILLLPGSLYASVWAYTWIQYDEYPEQIDVYGATHISGSYQEQYYFDFAISGFLYANGQLIDSDYEGWSCEGATAYVSVQGDYGTLYEFFGICDLKIYFHDICYPWWYDLGYYWYVSNPLYSPDAGIWEPFDPICLDDLVLAGIGVIYAQVRVPCAYPTGLAPANWHDGGNGWLQINYVWTSSTGNWQSLRNCQFREWIAWGGEYPAPMPPWGSSPSPNPLIGDAIFITNYYFTDNYNAGSFVKPYRASTYWGDQ